MVSTLTLRAMGLVYVTILSIVPMLAITFSVLKGFDIHRRIEPLLYTFLEPLGDRGRELTDQLMGFVDNVKGGVLAGAGLLLLFYTTLSMIKKVEDSFNYVWRVEHPRGFLERFSQYLSIILVGPVIMATAMTLIATVGSNAFVAQLSEIQPFGLALVLLGKLLPYFLICLGFALVYWFVPNTRVKFFAALVGGICGGFLWATVGVLFTTFVVGATRNFDIYSSFAIVIIALMWLYVSWLILLVGAQIAFYLQHPEYLRIGYRLVNVGNRVRERIAIGLMASVAQAFHDSRKGPTVEDVAEVVQLPAMVLSPVLERLILAGLIVRTSSNRLLPARDPASIGLRDAINAVRNVQEADIFQDGHWPENVMEVSAATEDAMDGVLGHRNIYDLLSDADGGD